MTTNVTANKYKLIGKNYVTPDLLAKVTGKAKYAEDYRADGMLFCKLALSPMPHARVRSIDARAALAMPGVKAILTMDELPPPANSINDNGNVILANPRGYRALTNEPLFQGQPILAVAAIDELTAADAIEKIKIDLEPLPFVVDPLVSLKPGGPNARLDGNVWVRPTPPPPQPGKPPAVVPPELQTLKWTSEDFEDAKQGRLPMGKPTEQWTVGDVDAGLKNAALVLDETFVTPNTSHQCLETRSAMAYW
ncbi:MAG: Aldehyde oxidase, partial [Candidatus Acidoferrum typicum]|nr:Aldehyde oxidase [Candidatus Acidoferrum typicum]